MKFLIIFGMISFSLVSCNVVQLLTDGETDLDQDFYSHQNNDDKGKCNFNNLCDESQNPLATAAASFAGGTGSSSDPYIICNVDQLQMMDTYLTSYFEIGQDFSATGHNFIPVATCTSSTTCANYFTGSLNGNSCTIDDLTINQTGLDERWNGLFGQLGTGAVVTNLYLTNADVNAGVNGINGILAGYATGATITDIYVDGKLVGGYLSGGVVGELRDGSKFGRVKSNIDLDFGTASYAGDIGGAIGRIYSNNISNAVSVYQVGVTGDVNAGNAGTFNPAGGVIGAAIIGSPTGGHIHINDIYNMANVSGRNYTGGIVGRASNNGSAKDLVISNTYNGGSVSGDNYTGGLIGGNITAETDLLDSFNSGIVTASNAANAGWVIGYNSFNPGTSTGLFTLTGGTPADCDGTNWNTLNCTTVVDPTVFNDSSHSVFTSWSTSIWGFNSVGFPMLNSIPRL